MKTALHLRRSGLCALPVFAALALACSGAEQDGAELPPYFGALPGAGSPNAPSTPVAPNTPSTANGVGPDTSVTQQPADGQSETPVNDGETPLTGAEDPSDPAGDGTSAGTGDGTGTGDGAGVGNGTGSDDGAGTDDGTGSDDGSGEPPVTTPPVDEVPDEQPPAQELPPEPPPANPPRGDRGTANLFVDLIGRTPGEVETKVQTAVNRFFGIGSNDPATPTVGNGVRSFYVLPQDSSMGFVWAADSADIRSEGMSYGMFIAVQMNMQREFDQLWRFARRFMQYPADTNLPAWSYYFRWTGTVNTQNASNWQVNYNPEESPASDGEEYFAAALYLADRRWGSGGAINYQEDADLLSNAMLNNPAGQARFPLIHEDFDMVSFVPIGTANDFTDPSYHLPAFYEIFAQDGPPSNAERWRRIAEVSRDFLVRSAHPQTGLHPDYATYQGAPTQGTSASTHDDFRFDAWRVPLNMAVDFAWSGQDARMRAQADRYVAFFANNVGNGNVTNSLFNVDGSGAGGGGASGLVGALGAAALASTNAARTTMVNNLWNLAQPTGQFRYYQGAVYLLGLLATSGRFDYTFQ